MQVHTTDPQRREGKNYPCMRLYITLWNTMTYSERSCGVENKLWVTWSTGNIGHTHFHGEGEDISRNTLDHKQCLAADKFTTSFFIEICSSLDAIILVLSTVLHEAVAMQEDEEL